MREMIVKLEPRKEKPMQVAPAPVILRDETEAISMLQIAEKAGRLDLVTQIQDLAAAQLGVKLTVAEAVH